MDLYVLDGSVVRNRLVITFQLLLNPDITVLSSKPSATVTVKEYDIYQVRRCYRQDCVWWRQSVCWVVIWRHNIIVNCIQQGLVRSAILVQAYNFTVSGRSIPG